MINFRISCRILAVQIVSFLFLPIALAAPGLQAESDPGSGSAAATASGNAGRQIASCRTGEPTLGAMIQQTLIDRACVQRMREEIRSLLTPEKRAALFLREFHRFHAAQGLTGSAPSLNRSRPASLSRPLTAGYGTIEGKAVLSAPGTTEPELTFLAFDKEGYFVRLNTMGYYDDWEGAYYYEIDSLLAGEYYLVCTTKDYAYVDQMYEGVDAPLLSHDAWRAAKTVTVSAGSTTDSINFHLRSAAQFKVRVYRSDGITLLSEDDLTFTFTSFAGPDILIRQEYEFSYEDSTYTLYMPLVGDFKLGLTMPGSTTAMAWYQNVGTWEEAEKITVGSLSDATNLSFITSGAGAGDLGTMSGYIYANGDFMLISAFKVSDLTLGGVTLALEQGDFTIDQMPAGDYFVYADDYLGNFKPGGDGSGTFYKSGGTVSQADTVHVSAGQTTSGVDIHLRTGATIAGRVTDENNNPIDSIIVVTVNMDLADPTVFGLLTHFSPGVAETDALGHYQIRGLAPGNYIVRTASRYYLEYFWGFPMIGDGPRKDRFVDEFYPALTNLYDIGKAQKIAVQDTGTVENIDFRLPTAKFVKGRVYESATSAPVSRALVRARLDSSGGPFGANAVVDDQGNYRLGPLPSGKFRIVAVNDNPDRDFYLMDYYNNAHTFPEAATVEVKNTDVTGIDFGFDPAAVIRGTVDLSSGGAPYPAGADTTGGFPIALFNAADGSLARLTYVQFNGGFSLPRLLPGSYKLLALPMNSPYGTTYYGGGSQFNDAQAQVIQVSAGQDLQLNPTLLKAGGTIKGTVKDKKTGRPVANCLVVAYDATGHAAGLALTDSSSSTIVERPATGEYQITGLRAGAYRLRTFAQVDAAEVLAPLVLGGLTHINPLSMSLAMMGGMMGTNMAFYSDEWYGDVQIPNRLDIPGMAATVLMYGVPNDLDCARIPLFMPLPLVEHFPAGATTVSVPENGTVQDIHFTLVAGDFSELFSGVNNGKDGMQVTAYGLYQNYPNPFNPTTMIRYDLPKESRVVLKVYNVLGQEIATLVDEELRAGRYRVRFDAKNLASGVYFYRMNAGSFSESKKFVILR